MLHFVDTSGDLVRELRRVFDGVGDVVCSDGDILEVARNAIVSPANSYGHMDGGIDAAYAAFFGPRLQAAVQEAINRRPEGHLPVGASLAVRTGHERIPFMIVAPTMHTPEEVPSENCYRAMRAVLRLMRAEPAIGREVFCPGLATGIGRVPPAEAAEQLFRAYDDCRLSSGPLLARRKLLLGFAAVCADRACGEKEAFAAGTQSDLRWNETSQLKAPTPAAELRAIANGGTFDRERRARAVFSLFANYLRPPRDGAAMQQALGRASWLASARLEGVYSLGGWIPVELTDTDTVFCLKLFPNEKGWSEWVIYFRLSGGDRRPVTEAETFLSGRDSAGSPKMPEFALCFPPTGKNRMGRIERFSPKGIAAYDPW